MGAIVIALLLTIATGLISWFFYWRAVNCSIPAKCAECPVKKQLLDEEEFCPECKERTREETVEDVPALLLFSVMFVVSCITFLFTCCDRVGQ